MNVGSAGIALIKKWEGLVDGDPDTPGLDPYRCPADIPTIGWGSTWDLDGSRITMDHPPIDIDYATRLLERELRHVQGAIQKLVSVPLSQGQYDAVASLTYNVGSGRLQSSTLRMKLNRYDYTGASNEFWKWRRANGRILRGLVLRRAEEKALFLQGDLL